MIALALLALKLPVARAQPSDASRWFATGLALHVNLGMNVWLLAFGTALNALVFPPRTPRLAWTALGLAATGTVALVAASLTGARVVLSNYVPVIDHSLFFAGCAAIGSGALLASIPALWRAPRGTFAEIGEPLRAAAWSYVGALAALGAAAAALPEDMSRDAAFEVLAWGYGHVLQLAFVLWMICAWHSLAGTGRTGSGGLALAAGWGYTMLLAAAAIMALEPAASASYREWFTRHMSWGLWIAPALAVAGAARAGVLWPCRGLAAEREAFLLSAALFALGCAAGAGIRGESTLVPAHYHGMIGAVSLAMMGWTPKLVAAVGRDLPAAALRTPLRAYGGGLFALIGGLAWLGVEGYPRKALGTAAHAQDGSVVALALALAGGAVAIAGATWYAIRLGAALRRGGPLGPAAEASSQPQRRDVRPSAIAAALVAVVLGGATLSWISGESASPRSARVDARIDPAGHARSMQRAEFDARFQQAVVMLHARQYEHALTALHRLLEIAPEVPEVHVNMGYALLGLKRHAAARDFFLGATALRPAQANAYYGLAVALEALGDLPGALGAMRTYVHLTTPEDPWLPKARAALWEWQSRPAAAAK